MLRGMMRVEYEGGAIEVRAGQAIVTAPGEWVRYSTPEEGGAEYVAVCTPAFSPDTVHRDADVKSWRWSRSSADRCREATGCRPARVGRV